MRLARGGAPAAARGDRPSPVLRRRETFPLHFSDLLRDRIDLGLRHGDEEQDVPAQQMHGAVDDFGAHGGFSEIGDPEYQRTARLKATKQGGGAEVVSLAGLGSHLCQQFDHLAEMSCAASWQKTLLDGLAVSKQANAIAGEQRQLRQCYGSGACVVELGVFANVRGPAERCVGSRGGDYARAHQPSAVEHDPHRLAALGLVLARDQVSATRARGPADVAHVVAFSVIAQAFEIAPEASLAGLPQLEIDLSTAREKYLLLSPVRNAG